MLTELGKFLRKLRIDNYQNLSEMADILGISSANLSSIENGKRKPKQSMISVIIEKYNLNDCDIDRLWIAYFVTKGKISIYLDSVISEKHQNVGLMFVRNYNDLSVEQIERIWTILNKK